mgnify:CR=1 FL=1
MVKFAFLASQFTLSAVLFCFNNLVFCFCRVCLAIHRQLVWKRKRWASWWGPIWGRPWRSALWHVVHLTWSSLGRDAIKLISINLIRPILITSWYRLHLRHIHRLTWHHIGEWWILSRSISSILPLVEVLIYILVILPANLLHILLIHPCFFFGSLALIFEILFPQLL